MWYAIAGFVGFVLGLLLYHYLLDKPEVVNNENIEIRKVKQKNGTFWNNIRKRIEERKSSK